MMLNKKGQSILEYTLLLAAIIGVLVWVILNPSGIKSTVSGSYEKAGSSVKTTTNRLNFGIFANGSGTTSTE